MLSEKGHDRNYLSFKPSNMFMRVLGDDVLGLNEALFEFRSQGVEHLVLLDDERLTAYYGELNSLFEVIRDRVFVLVEYCNKGFDGHFDDALEMAERWAVEASEEAGDGSDALKAFGPSGPDVYEAVRQRNLEDGVLTEWGSEQGFVAFRSCPLYGRVVGEIVYSLNDALRRLEDRTPQYVAGGQVEAVRSVLRGVDSRHEAAARNAQAAASQGCGGMKLLLRMAVLMAQMELVTTAVTVALFGLDPPKKTPQNGPQALTGEGY